MKMYEYEIFFSNISSVVICQNQNHRRQVYYVDFLKQDFIASCDVMSLVIS